MSKKNFTDQLNQAQAEWFISPETKAKVDGTPAQANARENARQIAPEAQENGQTCLEPRENALIYDPKPDHETKSKRVQLLLKPSIFEALKERAVNEHTSVNDLINTLLLNSLKEH